MSLVLKLSIHATPGASRTEAAGAYGAALRVRLAAPPVDGKANTALIAWAAQAFGVPRSRVELLHGAAGRQKVLAIGFDSPTCWFPRKSDPSELSFSIQL